MADFSPIPANGKNSLLGEFRALATAKEPTVLLRYEAETVVLSPADFDGFAREINARFLSQKNLTSH